MIINFNICGLEPETYRLIHSLSRKKNASISGRAAPGSGTLGIHENPKSDPDYQGT